MLPAPNPGGNQLVATGAGGGGGGGDRPSRTDPDVEDAQPIDINELLAQLPRRVRQRLAALPANVLATLAQLPRAMQIKLLLLSEADQLELLDMLEGGLGPPPERARLGGTADADGAEARPQPTITDLLRLLLLMLRPQRRAEPKLLTWRPQVPEPIPAKKPAEQPDDVPTKKPAAEPTRNSDQQLDEPVPKEVDPWTGPPKLREWALQIANSAAAAKRADAEQAHQSLVDAAQTTVTGLTPKKMPKYDTEGSAEEDSRIRCRPGSSWRT